LQIAPFSRLLAARYEEIGQPEVGGDGNSAGGRCGAADGRPSILDDGDFIDPRAWSEERFTPAVGVKVVDEIERRTIKDAPAAPTTTMASQAAEARKSGLGKSSSAASGDAPLGPVNASLSGPTPGPDALAHVLEPSIVTVGHPPAQRAGRSFLLGAAVGVVLLGAVVAALVVRKNAGAQPPQAQTAQP